MTVLITKFAAAALAAVLGASGLAYAGVPLVPNPVKAVVDVVIDGEENGEESDAEPQDQHLPQPAQEGQATAQAKREAAERFSQAMQAWTDCVAEKAPQHEESGAEGDFDPEADPPAGCGPKPNPQDEEFSPLTEPASDQGTAGQELGEQMRQEHQPEGTSDEDEEEEEVENGPSPQNNPGAPPDGTPSGPPEGAPGP